MWADQQVCNAANIEPSGDLSCDGWSYLNGKCMPITLGGHPEDEQATICDGAECNIGRQVDTSGLEGYDAYGCFDCVPSGLRAKATEDCCALDSVPSVYKEGYDVICKSGTPDPDTIEATVCKNSFEKSLGNLLYPKYFDNCKTAYMMILIGGGFTL